MFVRPTFALATAAAAVGGLLALSGCTSDPNLVGQMGVTANSKGQAVLVLATCGGEIDDVTLGFLPVGKQNRSGQIGEWKRSSKVTGTSRLDLTAPADGWDGPTQTLQPAPYYIASASSTKNGSDALNDMTFRGRQIKKLDPSKVYVNSDNPDSDKLIPHSADSFHAWACSR